MKTKSKVSMIIILAIIFPLLGSSETKINDYSNDDGNVKNLTLQILYSVPESSKFVETVTIYDEKNVPCNRDNSVGCFDPNKKEIKIISPRNYENRNGICNTFNNTLYHEIGHAYGNYYLENNSEEYADEFANKYSKDRCNDEAFNSLKNEVELKGNALNNSEKEIGKWRYCYREDDCIFQVSESSSNYMNYINARKELDENEKYYNEYKYYQCYDNPERSTECLTEYRLSYERYSASYENFYNRYNISYDEYVNVYNDYNVSLQDYNNIVKKYNSYLGYSEDTDTDRELKTYKISNMVTIATTRETINVKTKGR